jgi:hypothetical protein
LNPKSLIPIFIPEIISSFGDKTLINPGLKKATNKLDAIFIPIVFER